MPKFRTPGAFGKILSAINAAELKDLTFEIKDQDEINQNLEEYDPLKTKRGRLIEFLKNAEVEAKEAKKDTALGKALTNISTDYYERQDKKNRTALVRAGFADVPLTPEEVTQLENAIIDRRVALITQNIGNATKLSDLPIIVDLTNNNVRKGLNDHKDVLTANMEVKEDKEMLIPNAKTQSLATAISTRRNALKAGLIREIETSKNLNDFKNCKLWDNNNLNPEAVRAFLYQHAPQQIKNYGVIDDKSLNADETKAVADAIQKTRNQLLTAEVNHYFSDIAEKKNVADRFNELEDLKLYKVNGEYDLTNVRKFIKTVLDIKTIDIGLTGNNDNDKLFINDDEAKKFAEQIEKLYLQTLRLSISEQTLETLAGGFKAIFENNGETKEEAVRKAMKEQEIKIGKIGLTQNDGHQNEDKIALKDDKAKEVGKFIGEALAAKIIKKIENLPELSLEEKGLLHNSLDTDLKKENDSADTAKLVRKFLGKNKALFGMDTLADDEKYFGENGNQAKFLPDDVALKIRDAILLRRAELIQSKILSGESSSVSGVLEKNKINKADKTLEEGLDLLAKATEEKSKNESRLLNITEEITEASGQKRTILTNQGSANTQAFKQISKELKKKEANKYELYLTICDDYVDPSRTSLSPDQTKLQNIHRGLREIIEDLTLYHENLKRQIEIAESNQPQQGKLTYDEVKKLSDENDFADRIIKIHDNLASYKERLDKAANLIANAKTILANTNSMMLNTGQKLGIGRKELELIKEDADINAVQQEVTQYLAGAGANGNAGGLQAEAVAQKHVTEQKCSAMKVECRTEKGNLIKTAAVRTYDQTTAKVDIMMNPQESGLLSDESRQGKFSTKPSIPSANTMFLAERYLDVLLPMMKPNATVTIIQGNLPNILIEAIIIACKARSPQIKYNAPAGYADEVSDRQVSHYKDINSNNIKKQARRFGDNPDYKNVRSTLPVDIDPTEESKILSKLKSIGPRAPR